MTHQPANTPPKPKGTNLWVVFVLLLGATAGAAYLGLQNIDWTENLPSLPKAAIEPPSGQAAAPVPGAPGFDAVSADAAGMLVAAGKAQPGATVVLQNGGQTLGGTKADENGEWVLTLEQPLPAGPYDLSLFSVDPQTQVRVPGAHHYALTIAPYNKKAPAAVQTAAAAQPPASNSAVTTGAEQQSKKPAAVTAVRRGDTLWGIAEHFYGRGKGARYGEIASANKDQIKNPDLIYPNQQFAIPEKKAP